MIFAQLFCIFIPLKGGKQGGQPIEIAESRQSEGGQSNPTNRIESNRNEPMKSGSFLLRLYALVSCVGLVVCADDDDGARDDDAMVSKRSAARVAWELCDYNRPRSECDDGNDPR